MTRMLRALPRNVGALAVVVALIALISATPAEAQRRGRCAPQRAQRAYVQQRYVPAYSNYYQPGYYDPGYGYYDPYYRRSSKTKDTLTIVGTGAGGALVGGLVGGKKGAIIGAAVGAGLGGAIVYRRHHPRYNNYPYPY